MSHCIQRLPYFLSLQIHLASANLSGRISGQMEKMHLHWSGEKQSKLELINLSASLRLFNIPFIQFWEKSQMLLLISALFSQWMANYFNQLAPVKSLILKSLWVTKWVLCVYSSLFKNF